MDKINLIGVSLAQPEEKHPLRRKLKVSVTRDSGAVQQFSCNLVNWERRRELKQNVKPELLEWYGYDQVLRTQENLVNPQNSYVGKLKNVTRYQRGIPRNMPIVAETAVLFWYDNDTDSIMSYLVLGSNEFLVPLYATGMSKTQQNFYAAVGYWRAEPEMEEGVF